MGIFKNSRAEEGRYFAEFAREQYQEAVEATKAGDRDRAAAATRQMRADIRNAKEDLEAARNERQSRRGK